MTPHIWSPPLSADSVPLFTSNLLCHYPDEQDLLAAAGSDGVSAAMGNPGRMTRSPVGASVKLGSFSLTCRVKLGYNTSMVRTVISFILRIGFVIGLWGLVWSLVEPRTQAMRILRAALLVLGLLGVWTILSIIEA